MLGQTARGSRLNVAEQANFERNSFIQNVLREVAQLHYFAVFRYGDVFDEARSVADAMRSAVLNGLPDRFFPKAFAGVNGDVEILALNIMKRVDMFFGWESAFFASEIESHNSAIAEVHGEFGHFDRHVHIAHRADNQSRRNSNVVFAALQAL